ncbi:serine hydrolase domain-containing protein [Vibrio hepatarius]|uniref:serine hydrolase domain-containing protein n=1 Tax=Vibrio hepatarius TaxID=171383 RepID=UPI00142D1ED5|nr:serine hydrolase domain-containing protein [Vibrio hepatarius]NIY84182.1 beta-lactamase family protein [Vibrio hepatarius]
MRWKSLCFLLLVSASVYAEPKSEALSHLLPMYQYDGESQQPLDLVDRMRYWDIPGVSITVFDKGEIIWTHAEGVKNKADEPVAVDSVFQMASISKPVTTLLVLKAVDEGKVTLDEDIRPLLIAELKAKATQPVSLRQLLSHTAGFASYGLAGFTRDQYYPSLAELAKGEYGTLPFEQNQLQGQFSYSNVGYIFVQSVLETLYKKSFEEIAKSQLIDLLGLRHTSFDQKNIEYLGLDLAHGSEYGSWIDGGWNRFSSKAAAGLWTSTPDLAQLLINIHEIYTKQRQGFIPTSTLKVISEPIQPFLGLGFFRYSDERGTYVFHGGINRGYESHFVLYPELGSGAVVATNGQGGGALALEIIRALSIAYDWPNYQLNRQKVERPRLDELNEYVGRYHYDGEFYADVTVKEGQLFIQGKDQLKYPMYKVGEKLYRTFDVVSDFEFKTGWFSDEISSMVQKAPSGDYSADKE